jgi:hypothetical protein
MRRSKHSPAKTYLREWKLGNLMRLRSGVISSHSLGKSFLDWWTSSLEVTHANRSQPQESGLEQKILVTSGPTSQTVFEFSDLGSASLRTSKVTSALDSEKSLENWKSLVTKRRLEYSARLNAVRHISESGSSSWPSPVASEVRQGFQDRSRGMKGNQESLTTVVVKSWPTPVANDDNKTPEAHLAMKARMGERDGTHSNRTAITSLNVMVKSLHGPATPASWPTPNAADSLQGGMTQGNRKDPNLSIAVHGLAVPASSSTSGSRPGWLTPQAQDSKHSGTNPTENGDRDLLVNQVNWQTATVSTGAHKQKDGSMIDKLNQQVKSWATPDVSDRRSDNCRQIGLSNQTQGKLNPRWVETLMGLPVGWTMPSCASPVTIERMNSDSSETGSSQQQQNERSGH